MDKNHRVPEIVIRFFICDKWSNVTMIYINTSKEMLSSKPTDTSVIETTGKQ